MAEVTGDLGGQPIQLSNAATETTLQQLLAVMLSQTAKGGKQKLKDEKELRAELDRLGKAAKKAREQLLESAKDAEGKKAKEATVKQFKDLGRTIQDFTRSLSSTISSMANYASTLANMGNSVSNATGALDKIPIVGGILAATLGAVAKEAERQQKAFQQATAVGATFSGGITEMVNSASRMGLTFDQFSGIINRSGKDLALLGAGSADGAKQLAKYSTEMRKSSLQNDLARLGFSAEDITESLVVYGAQLRKLGYSQAQIDATLVQSTGDYLKNLDAVSKVTGLNRKDLEKQRADRMRDGQFRAMMAGKDKETVDSINSVMDLLGESQAKAFKEIASTGTAMSDEAKALFTTAPELAQAAMDAHRSLETTGKYSMAQASKTHEKAILESNQRMGMLTHLGKFGTETEQRMAVDAMNVGRQTLKFADAVDKTNEAAKVAGKNDPAALMRLQQETAATANKVSLALSDQFSKLSSLMQTFYKILHNYVIPTLEWAADNFALTVGALIGAKIGLEVFKSMLAKSFGGVVGGGASSILASTLKFVFSAMGLKLLLAGGAIFGLFTLAKQFTEGKNKQTTLRDLNEKHKAGTLTQEESDARDALRAGGTTATTGEAQRGTLRQMSVQQAKEWMKSGHDEEFLKKETGFSKKVIEEYAKTKGEVTIYDVAKKLGESVSGYIEQGSTGTRSAASLPGSENAGGTGQAALEHNRFDESGGVSVSWHEPESTTPDPSIIEDVNTAERERLAILEADKSLAGRRAYAAAQLAAREAERAREKAKLDEKIITQTKEEVAINEKNNACKGYDFSSPEALFKSFRDKNMQPGATGTPSAGGTTSTPGAAGAPSGSSYSEIIGGHESAGKYDTVFGQAGGAKINQKLITDNTIAEVIKWQKENKHTNRHAAGKYQFMNVEDVAKEAGVASDALFNAETQEKMQEAFTKRSARHLEKMGIAATNENLALAHSVGPGGAQKLLNAQKSGGGNQIAADVLGLTGAGRTTNPQLLKPVSEVIASHINRFAGQSVSNGAQAPNVQRPPVTPLANAATAAIAPQAAPVVPGQTTLNQPGTGAPGAGGASPVNELASAIERLNSMTAQIVGNSRDLIEVSRQQLTAIKTINRVV
jgi:hypothetical protein